MYNLNTTCQSLGFIIMTLWQCAPSAPTTWIMATKPIWSDNLEHDTVLYKIIVFTKVARDGKKEVLWCTEVWGTQNRFRQTLCTLYIVLFVTVITMMTSSHCTFIIINLDFDTFLLLYRYCALLHLGTVHNSIK